jgi:hypothetical protein
MIRGMLSVLFVGAVIFADPCPVSADTTTNPKKTPPKSVPQVPQSTTPSRHSKCHGSHPYHPHQAKGGAKHTKGQGNS